MSLQTNPPKEMPDRGAILESILFAAGESVSAALLAGIFETTKEEIRQEVEALQQYYEQAGRGVKIIELDGEYQMCTVEENYRYVQQIMEPKRQTGLSNAALETLAIVAYNQPITRGSIEYVRGVNSDGSVNKLIERGLIEENGRLDAPGRPILYITTQEFLRAFGLKSLDELPDLSQFNAQVPAELLPAEESAEEVIEGNLGVL